MAALYLARGLVLPPLSRWLDVGTAPGPADCVIVLGGGEETRPFVAAALVKAGLARRVLVSQTVSSPQGAAGTRLPAHEISRRVLRHRGVAEQDIVMLEPPAANTYEEALALGAFLDASPGARVSVVTSDYHTRRARWVFRHVLGQRATQLSFVSAPNEEFFAANWWQSPEGFIDVVGEYLKFAFYVLRYSPLCDAILAGAACLLLAAFAYRRRPRNETEERETRGL